MNAFDEFRIALERSADACERVAREMEVLGETLERITEVNSEIRRSLENFNSDIGVICSG